MHLRVEMGLPPKAASQTPSGPCVFYAVAKAVKKGEDFFVCLPAQPWPESTPRENVSDTAYGLYVLVDGVLHIHNSVTLFFSCSGLPGT